MKIVFIQPKSFFTWEAIGVGYISAYLKKHMDDIEIDFFTEFFDDREDIIAGCEGADIIGLSVTSPQYKNALELSKILKNDNNIIVMGGFHPTNVPGIIKESSIDIIVQGEGEKAMLEICQGRRDSIIKCDYIKELDSIPFVDRDVIKQDRHLERVQKHFQKRIMSITMSRGCPFNCTFCASKSLWSRKVRLRSPQNIMDEFNLITNRYRLDFVSFCDDEIGINKKHLIEFCNLKTKSGNKTPWGCNAVASCMDEEMVTAMVNANCTEIWMGVESGDDNILKDMKKANTVEQIKEAFSITKGKLKRRSYCILGMPNESYDTIKKTEKLLDAIKPEIVGFTILAPYPGSEFYDKDYDWSVIDEYTNEITSTKHLTNKELRSEQNRLTVKYCDKITYRNIA